MAGGAEVLSRLHDWWIIDTNKAMMISRQYTGRQLCPWVTWKQHLYT